MEWTWWRVMWIELEMSRRQATACYRLVHSNTGLQSQNARPYSAWPFSPQLKHTCSFPCLGVLVCSLTLLICWGLGLYLTAPDLISLSRVFFQSEKYLSWLHLSLCEAQMEPEPQVRGQPIFHKGLPPLIWTVVSFEQQKRSYTSVLLTLSVLFITTRVILMTSSSTFFFIALTVQWLNQIPGKGCFLLYLCGKLEVCLLRPVALQQS